MTQSAPASCTPDKEYYWHFVTFSIKGRLFRVPKCRFVDDSESFADPRPEGQRTRRVQYRRPSTEFECCEARRKCRRLSKFYESIISERKPVRVIIVQGRMTLVVGLVKQVVF